MSKSKKFTNRIIAVLLIVLGLILGGTWNSAKYCIGDKIFIALGISPWSNGSSGTHYPAIIGSFVILAGISIVKAKLFCPEIAGLFCRIAGLFCHDSRANLSLKPVCFGIAIS